MKKRIISVIMVVLMAGALTIMPGIDTVSAETVDSSEIGSEISSEETVQPSLKLDQTSLKLGKGKTAQLKLTTKGITEKVVWSSSNKKIAKVSNSGKITAIKAGKCTINAKVGSSSAKCKVTVINNVKLKTGYYRANDDHNCLVIKEINGNTITFELGSYSEKRIGLSKDVTVTLKNKKAKYRAQLDGWNNEITTGTIKVVNSRTIRLKSNGGYFYAYGTKWRTYTYKSSSTVLNQGGLKKLLGLDINSDMKPVELREKIEEQMAELFVWGEQEQDLWQVVTDFTPNIQ